MLGDGLSKINTVQLSRSSTLHKGTDERKLMDLLDQKDKIIRRLNNRLEKQEEMLKRFESEKSAKDSSREAVSKQSMHLKLLKAEIGKTKRLQEIIDQITQRVNAIIEDLSNDNSLTESSRELKEIILMLETSKNQCFYSENEQNQNQESMNISAEWMKKIDILEGTFKSFKLQFIALRGQNKSLASQIEGLQGKVSDLQAKMSGNEEVIHLTLQLKQQKKQKQKMKKLLEITEFSKNQIINKINSTALREDIIAKTKEELLQHSKELNYRIKDLEKEKACIIKETTKGKQDQLRKYQELLRKLKHIKDKSILTMSYA